MNIQTNISCQVNRRGAQFIPPAMHTEAGALVPTAHTRLPSIRVLFLLLEAQHKVTSVSHGAQLAQKKTQNSGDKKKNATVSTYCVRKTRPQKHHDHTEQVVFPLEPRSESTHGPLLQPLKPHCLWGGEECRPSIDLASITEWFRKILSDINH